MGEDDEVLEPGEIRDDSSQVHPAKKASVGKRKVIKNNKVHPPPSVLAQKAAGADEDVHHVEKKIGDEQAHMAASIEMRRQELIAGKFRTEPCSYYIRGMCKKGDACTYSHEVEIAKKDEECKFFRSGSCLKGDQCRYSHEARPEPCVFYHYFKKGTCTIANCRYYHGELTEGEQIRMARKAQRFNLYTMAYFGTKDPRVIDADQIPLHPTEPNDKLVAEDDGSGAKGAQDEPMAADSVFDFTDLL